MEVVALPVLSILL